LPLFFASPSSWAKTWFKRCKWLDHMQVWPWLKKYIYIYLYI
jgi:hypothetical protein